MAVPANLASISFTGDARSLLLTYVPGDTTETGFKVEFSFDNGSSWTDPLIAAAGVTLVTYHTPPQNVSAKARVTPYNGSGDASATTSSAVVVDVLPEVADGTDIWLIIGEDAATPPSINVGSMTALGATAINNLTAVAQIKLWIDDTQKYTWFARNLPSALPIFNSKAFIWNHVGLTATVTSIAPNTPTAGTTEVTFAGSLGRPNGHAFYTRFRSTGVSNMDNVELKVTVTASNKVRISSFTAASSSSTGTADLPSFDNYDEDVNAETDYRGLGFTPTRNWSFERSFLAAAQEARDATFGDGTNTTSLLLRVISPSPLISKLVGAGSTKRWSKERSGKSFSQWDVMVRLMEDAHAFCTNVGTSSSPAPYNIRGIIITAGYNDSSCNVAQVRQTHDIASVAIASGVVTITTSAAHNILDVVSSLYTVAKFEGINGTLGDAINGKHFPIHVTGSTTFEIVDFDGTGLAGTVTSGQTKVDTGAAIYFFRELLSQHIDDVRDAAITAWGSSQDPEDIPVLLMEPGYDPYLDFLESIVSAGTKAARDVAFGQFHADMRAIAGEKVLVRSLNLNQDKYAHLKSAGGLLTSGLFFSGAATIRIGEDAYDVITGAAASESALSRPCVIGIILGDSYVQGTTAGFLGRLRNPEVIAPQTVLTGGQGEPIDWLFVYNQSTEAIEQAYVDPSLDTAYDGRTNFSTHPTLNIGQSNRAGIQIAAARELRLAYPDNDIILFNLGVDGSTAAAHTNYVGSDGARIKAITPGATTTTIELETAGNGGTRINRTKPFNVTISGVTGLTPSIDGTRIATPIDMDTNPLTRGTQKFTISVGCTGTASVTNARVLVPSGIWDPSANDIWTEVVAQAPKFFAAVNAAGYYPNAEFAFVVLGTNDAALSSLNGQITPTSYGAAIGRILTGIRDQFTTKPDTTDAIGVVFLEPIKHGRATISTTLIGSFQTSLRSAISGDGRAITLNVDESSDRLTDAVTIDADRIHPDTNGYVQLGYRLPRRLAGIGTWDAPFNVTAGGSGAGGVVEVATP